MQIEEDTVLQAVGERKRRKEKKRKKGSVAEAAAAAGFRLGGFEFLAESAEAQHAWIEALGEAIEKGEGAGQEESGGQHRGQHRG